MKMHMKVEDLRKECDCLYALMQTASAMHRNIRLSKEYDYDDDLLWKVRASISTAYNLARTTIDLYDEQNG